MSSRSLEVKVGALILAAITLLVAFVFVMGGLQLEATYPMYVDFDNPQGLQPGAPLKVAGVSVGRIDQIGYFGHQTDEKGQRKPLVRVRVLVKKSFQERLHEDSLFYVTSQGVLGEPFLAADPGSPDKPAIAENASVRGIDPPRLDLLLAETSELLHSAVTVVRSNRKELGEAFDGLRRTLKGTGDFLEKNSGELDKIVSNVGSLTKNADDTLTAARLKYVEDPRIDQVIGHVDSLAASAARDVPPVLADARSTLASAKKLTDNLLGDDEQKKIRQTIHDVADIAQTGKALVADTQGLLSQIRRGKGTVGALVADEQLYDDLKEMIRDLKHNPWKFFWRE